MSNLIWVDVPQGYLYGFPKKYDPDRDGDMSEWIYASGYPRKEEIYFTRCWFVEPEDKTDAQS